MNKVVLTGRLAADATQRTAGETVIGNARIAVSRPRSKDGAQQADFISLVAFGSQGEFLAKYGKKGTKFDVVGRIQTGSYTKNDGTKVYTTDVVVESIEFGESKKSSETETSITVPEVPEEDAIPFG